MAAGTLALWEVAEAGSAGHEGDTAGCRWEVVGRQTPGSHLEDMGLCC